MIDLNKRNRLRGLYNELNFLRCHIYSDSAILERREEEFALKLMELDVIPDPECGCLPGALRRIVAARLFTTVFPVFA